MHHGVVDDVVGEIQQTADEGLVGLAPGFEDFLAGAVSGKGLGIETALRTDRHDDGILHLLRLHQAQHLGAEIVAPVRPAQAAAGDRSEAQVHAFNIRRPDEDFAIGLGQGQFFQQFAGDLDRDARLELSVLAGLIEVRPQRGFHQVEDAAQGPVMIQAGDIIERLAQLFGSVPDRVGTFLLVLCEGRIELDLGQVKQALGNVRVGGKRLFLDRLGRIQPGLLAIAGAGAQEGRLTPGHADLDNQAVEAVILGPALGHGQQRIFEVRPQHVQRLALDSIGLHLEVVHIGAIHQPAIAATAIDRESGLLHDIETEILQHRHHPRQRNRLADAIDLQAQLIVLVVRLAIDADRDLVRRIQTFQLENVLERLFRIIELAIASLEGVVIGRHAQTDRFRRGTTDMGFQVVFPGPGQPRHAAFEIGHVRLRVVERVEADDVVNPGQRPIAELWVEGREPAAEGFADQLAGLFADLGIVAVARHEEQGRDKTVELVAANEQFGARAVVQVQDAQRDLKQIILVGLEQLVAREVLDRVAQLLGRVGARRLAGPLEHATHLAPDQRHGRRTLVIGLGSEQADKARLADDSAVLAVTLDTDIVHVDPAVDAGLHVRLGDNDRAGFAQEGLDRRGQDRRLGALSQNVAVRIAQHAAAGFQPHRGMALGHGAVARHLEVIDAAAQEGEMVIAQPAQEFACLS